MSSCVLDASALLALLWQETGHQRVAQALIDGATMTTVNLSEVIARLLDHGMPERSIEAALGGLELTLIDFDRDLAFRAGLLRPATRLNGLSLGDRACLALAMQLGVPALTSDHVWGRLSIDVSIEMIR